MSTIEEVTKKVEELEQRMSVVEVGVTCFF